MRHVRAQHHIPPVVLLGLVSYGVGVRPSAACQAKHHDECTGDASHQQKQRYLQTGLRLNLEISRSGVQGLGFGVQGSGFRV